MDEIKVILRDFSEEDRNFILSTWLKGNYFGSVFFRQIPQDLYFKEYSKTIQEIMTRNNIRIKIACDQSKTSWISGFSVSIDSDLYWIYVRTGFRSKGIATALLSDQNITSAKSMTRKGKIIADHKGIIFNPFPF
jgi:hypothetical protein